MDRDRTQRRAERAEMPADHAATVGKQTRSQDLEPAPEAEADTGARSGALPRLDLSSRESAEDASGGEGNGRGWGFSDLVDGIKAGATAVKSAAATVGKAVVTLANTPVITHKTSDTAPGAPDTRTTVGVGEMVTFDSNMPGKWKADAAAPKWPKRSTGDQFVWGAMSRQGTAKISFVPDDKGKLAVDITMTVVEPTVDYLNPRATAFPGRRPGVAGVQMDTDVTYGPNTVSFANTTWWEKPGPATSATGYFRDHVKKRKRRLPYHNPNPKDEEIDQTNSGIVDSAGWWDFDAPYSEGSFEWVIPTYYKVVDGGSRHLITKVTQKCTIGADGTMTVTKGSSTMSRTP